MTRCNADTLEISERLYWSRMRDHLIIIRVRILVFHDSKFAVVMRDLANVVTSTVEQHDNFVSGNAACATKQLRRLMAKVTWMVSGH